MIGTGLKPDARFEPATLLSPSHTQWNDCSLFNHPSGNICFFREINMNKFSLNESQDHVVLDNAGPMHYRF